VAVLEYRFSHLTWYEVVWQRPFELDAIEEMLVHLAGLSTRGAIVYLLPTTQGGRPNHL
jgi:hypothetical protein